MAAGVGCNRRLFQPFPEPGNAGALHEAAGVCRFGAVINTQMAATALRLAGLQPCLPRDDDIAALAAAAPAVLAFFFSRIFNHGKLSKTLADIVFQRRVAETAAAFVVARTELMRRDAADIAAVTAAKPMDAAVTVAFLCGADAHQPAKAHIGEVYHAGLNLACAAAACHLAALQTARVKEDLAAAGAMAAPDVIPAFSSVSFLCHCEPANAVARFDCRPNVCRMVAHILNVM